MTTESGGLQQEWGGNQLVQGKHEHSFWAGDTPEIVATKHKLGEFKKKSPKLGQNLKVKICCEAENTKGEM